MVHISVGEAPKSGPPYPPTLVRVASMAYPVVQGLIFYAISYPIEPLPELFAICT